MSRSYRNKVCHFTSVQHTGTLFGIPAVSSRARPCVIGCASHNELQRSSGVQRYAANDVALRSGCLQVFHSAEHSRHPHSLGVAHLAYRMANTVAHKLSTAALHTLSIAQVAPSADQSAQLALAGLAHDLGHGPCSHLWERCMRQLAPRVSIDGSSTDAAWCAVVPHAASTLCSAYTAACMHASAAPSSICTRAARPRHEARANSLHN